MANAQKSERSEYKIKVATDLKVRPSTLIIHIFNFFPSR